jgi:DNA-binding transcriptional LysR family regulator
MKNVSWDLYQVFLSVARHGGLTGAANATGGSPATIGRRILELEESIGRPLFHRSQAGYGLTQDGQILFDQLQDMEATARRVDSWKREAHGAVTLRIWLGTWVARFFADNIMQLCTERDPFRLDLMIAEQRARLTHREADIGIRAFRPEEANLAAKAMPDVAYAAYRARTARPSDTRWIAVDPDNAASAYLRWPHENRSGDIAFTVSRPTAMLDLAVAGAGHCLLPCFIGDQDPRLERVGEPMAELQHGQWIVMNRDDRHRREIRTMIDRITKLMKSRAGLFAGRRA